MSKTKLFRAGKKNVGKSFNQEVFYVNEEEKNGNLSENFSLKLEIRAGS